MTAATALVVRAGALLVVLGWLFAALAHEATPLWARWAAMLALLAVGAAAGLWLPAWVTIPAPWVVLLTMLVVVLRTGGDWYIELLHVNAFFWAVLAVIADLVARAVRAGVRAVRRRTRA